MVSSLPLLPCELSVFVKENPDRKKIHIFDSFAINSDGTSYLEEQ